MAWNHQFVDGAGRVKPCCRFKGNLGKLEDSLNSNFYNDKMSELRKTMLSGERHQGCSRCWQEEDSNKKSLRQRYNDHNILGLHTIDINNPKIEWLELAISNECNLACRMCSSRYSYKLYDEELAIFGKTSVPEKRIKMDIESVYENLENLKHLKITGGEPLVTPDHWKLIDRIIAKGLAGNIYLNYSTNNSVFPKESIVNRWKQFKYVELAISLDSIKDVENEYLRFPSKQSEVIRNINGFLDLKNQLDIRIIARPTITILNVYHLPETLEWLFQKEIKFNATHLTDPAYLSITVLPKKEKEKIVNKFNDFNYSANEVRSACQYIINYMLSKDDSHLVDEFKKYTKGFDLSRGQSFEKTYPYFEF